MTLKSLLILCHPKLRDNPQSSTLGFLLLGTLCPGKAELQACPCLQSRGPTACHVSSSVPNLWQFPGPCASRAWPPAENLSLFCRTFPGLDFLGISCWFHGGCILLARMAQKVRLCSSQGITSEARDANLDRVWRRWVAGFCQWCPSVTGERYGGGCTLPSPDFPGRLSLYFSLPEPQNQALPPQSPAPCNGGRYWETKVTNQVVQPARRPNDRTASNGLVKLNTTLKNTRVPTTLSALFSWPL